jgi:hypothetical protein
MSSRTIVNLLLLLAIVILGLVARYEPGIEAPAENQSITTIKADQVHRIHVNRPIRNDLVFVRNADRQWILERDTPLPADAFKIRALARLAEQKPVRSYPVEEMDLADLQLDPPYASAIINDTSIEFGILEHINDLRYVRVTDQIHLIPDTHLQLMEAGFSQFVRPELFGKDERITSVQLPDLLVRKTETDWEADPAQSVSSSTLGQFIDNWQQAKSLHIQPASAGLDGEPVSIGLANDMPPVQLLIITRDPELVLARPDYGVQYRMGSHGKAMLAPDAVQADTRD